MQKGRKTKTFLAVIGVAGFAALLVIIFGLQVRDATPSSASLAKSSLEILVNGKVKR